MGSESGRLWELATVACWLAEEEEKQRKAGDVGLSRTSSRAKDAMGLTSLEAVVDEEEGQRRKKKMKATHGITHPAVVIADEEEKRRKWKAELFAEVGSCSKSGAAQDGRGITPPMLRKRVTSGPVAMGWMEKAVRMGGTRPQLVVKKRISKTDLDPHFARLPLPFSRPGAPSMGGVVERLVTELSPAEHRAVHGDQGLAMTVLDRWGREYDGVILKKWPSKWYVLTNGKLVTRILQQGNALKAGDVVEIFRFRVPPPQPQPTGTGGGPEGRLVLVVSVAEADGMQQQGEHWSTAEIPRRPRSPPQRTHHH